MSNSALIVGNKRTNSVFSSSTQATSHLQSSSTSSTSSSSTSDAIGMVAKNLVTPLILLSLAVVVVLVSVLFNYNFSTRPMSFLILTCLVAVAVDDNLLYVVDWGQET